MGLKRKSAELKTLSLVAPGAANFILISLLFESLEITPRGIQSLTFEQFEFFREGRVSGMVEISICKAPTNMAK